MVVKKPGLEMFDLAMQYGLCAELLLWKENPDVFAQEVRSRVKKSADLLSDVFKDKSLETSLNLICKAIGQDDWATLSDRCQEMVSLSKQPWENRASLIELVASLRSVFPFMSSTSGALAQPDDAQQLAMVTFARDVSAAAGLSEDDGRRFVAVMNGLGSWDLIASRKVC